MADWLLVSRLTGSLGRDGEDPTPVEACRAVRACRRHSTVSRTRPAPLVSAVTGGTYLLVYELADPATVEIGAVGEHSLSPGGYVYVGSALGTGGFGRIDRHERVARGTHDTRHWHVDYLGGHDAVRLVTDRRLPGEAVECALARELTDGPVPGFGASDCSCASHLASYSTPAAAVSAVESAIRAIGE